MRPGVSDERKLITPDERLDYLPFAPAATSGPSEAIHVLLEPQLISRVAAEAYDLDPARVELSTVYDLSHPRLRAAIRARHRLATGEAGGRLLAESLGNVLAVHLIRHFVPTEWAAMRRAGGSPSPSSEPLSSTSRHTSTPSWRRTTAPPSPTSAPSTSPGCSRTPPGCPPHQYVIARRVKPHKQLHAEAGTTSR